MLHHCRTHRVIRDETPRTSTVAIQTGTDLLHHLIGTTSLLRRPFHDAAHLTVQIVFLHSRRNPSVHYATSIIFRRYDHIVATVGQLLYLKLGWQLSSMVHSCRSGFVKTVQAAPSSETDATTNNVHNQLE